MKIAWFTVIGLLLWFIYRNIPIKGVNDYHYIIKSICNHRKYKFKKLANGNYDITYVFKNRSYNLLYLCVFFYKDGEEIGSLLYTENLVNGKAKISDAIIPEDIAPFVELIKEAEKDPEWE